MTHTTREAWLLAAIDHLTPLFAELDETVPPVRVSVGWPGGSGNRAHTIGQCWKTSASSDGVAQLFISPVLEDAVDVLAVLVHELVHAVDDCENGHKGPFVKTARALGLEGKPTATVPGDELAGVLAEMAETLGTYPHAAIARGESGAKKQTTRMLKAECAEGSGYKVRTTRRWLEEYGAPLCPCHGVRMEAGS